MKIDFLIFGIFMLLLYAYYFLMPVKNRNINNSQDKHPKILLLAGIIIITWGIFTSYPG